MSEARKILWEKYRKELERVRSDNQKKKGEAWLKIPHEVFGVLLEPLSLRKLLYLEEIDCPLIHEQESNLEDVIHFVWVCSGEFTLDKSGYENFRKKLKLKNQDVSKEISEYIETSFRFIGFSAGKASDDEHFATGVIDLLGDNYGWTADYILDLPLNQTFQLISAIIKRMHIQAGKPPISFNREEDEIKARFMRELNQRN